MRLAWSVHTRQAFPLIMNERRVVITGIGCITPLGKDLTTTWDGLKEGRSGIGTITQFDTTAFDCKIGGEVKDFNADDYFNVPKDARRSDRYVQLAVAASKMAMEDCGIDISTIDSRRFGVMVGSGIGGLSTLEREHSTYIDQGAEAGFRVHDPDDDFQHRQRHHFHGIRFART